jgi:hypothetical protein
MPRLVLLVASVILVGPACAGRSASTSGSTSAAQGGVVPVRMSPVPLEFELDPRVWHEQNVGTSTNAEVVGARSFVRDKASPAARCPADLMVVGEHVPGVADVAHFSASKRFGMPPATIELVFGWQDGTIQLSNAVGYRLRGSEGCEPVAYMVHALEGGYGITIIIEIDPSDYALLEKEILALLRSFRALPAG